MLHIDRKKICLIDNILALELALASPKTVHNLIIILLKPFKDCGAVIIINCRVVEQTLNIMYKSKYFLYGNISYIWYKNSQRFSSFLLFSAFSDQFKVKFVLAMMINQLKNGFC